MTQANPAAPDRPSPHEHSSGPELPEARMHVAKPNAPVTARVVSSEICTNGKGRGKAASFVRHIAIDVSGTALAGQFIPGQSFGVIPPGTDARGLSHKLRLYSVASPSRGEDGQGNVIATTVKRTIDEHESTHRLFLGVASNYLCDLHPGDSLQVTGPQGKRFLLPKRPDEHDYLFFATGTGIAPFRAMIFDLLSARVSSQITLVMGAAYATDLLYHKDLLALAEKHKNFRYLTAISREKQEDGTGPLYVQDRLDTHAEELTPLLQSPRSLVYVCGIAGMELGIFQRLANRLAGPELEGFLGIDAEIRSETARWERRMLHKQVRPTRRVFLEVY